MGQIGIKAWIYKGEILPAASRGKAEGELERR
jgi:ribosomal protein S3